LSFRFSHFAKAENGITHFSRRSSISAKSFEILAK